MRKFLIAAIEQLHGVMIMLAVISGIAVLLSIFNYSVPFYFFYGLLVLIPFTVSAVAAQKCRGIGLFLVFCLISLVPVVFFMPDLVSKIVYMLLSVIVILIRMVGRVKDKPTILETPHFATVILFAFFFILGIVTERSFFAYLNYYLAFIYMISVLIYMNLTSLEGYLAVNRDVRNVPVRTIWRTNYFMLGGYLLLTIGIMFIMPLIGLDRGIMAIGRGFLRLIRYLASLHKGDDSGPEIIEETVEETQADTGGGMGFMGDGNPTPLWLEALYHALAVALGVVVGIIVLIAIGVAIYRLVKAFYRPQKENSDEEEFISNEQDDREGAPDTNFFTRIREVFDPNPNVVIRRAYKKRIKKQKKGIIYSMTPEELEEYTGIPEGEERQVLHELYEKARYSKAGCDNTDVQRLKKSAAG
ncbi:MAG: hypothetical protein IKR59_01290 [Lachnospiraceae bacterium]|nr:hypothetical protein [Lachnospiraceae bacterium]